jgi:peptidoglycan/LPS O-acetylase OafA/YrhL
MSDPALKPSTYLPTLDGWRALSITLVVLHHSQIQSSIPILAPLLQFLAHVGEVGVELFFAISGLLICSRLLDEESRGGQISVKGFYLRRVFRILPAAFFYLLVISILALLHVIPVFPMDWFASLFFFRNYVMLFEYLNHSPLPLHWYTGHFWSLSMEEHFYLVLPAVLVAFKRTRRWVLAGMAISVALWRMVLVHVMHRDYQFNFRTDTHVDALLIPAMIALILYPLTRNQAARRYIPAWSFPVFLVTELLLLTTRVPCFFTLQAIVLPLLILSTVLHPNTVQGRILETKPLRWIGWISYSLYLWQQLFFGVNFVGSPPGLAMLRKPPINLVALLVCATFSYYAIEKPFIRLGHKLASTSNPRRRVDQASFAHTSTPDESPGAGIAPSRTAACPKFEQLKRNTRSG